MARRETSGRRRMEEGGSQRDKSNNPNLRCGEQHKEKGGESVSGGGGNCLGVEMVRQPLTSKVGIIKL